MIGPLVSPTVEDIFISQKEKLYRHLCLQKNDLYLELNILDFIGIQEN